MGDVGGAPDNDAHDEGLGGRKADVEHAHVERGLCRGGKMSR